jgi:hypothetical protein
MSSAVVAQTPSCPRMWRNASSRCLAAFGRPILFGATQNATRALTGRSLDDAAPRQAVRDELGAALHALGDERRVMISHRLVERQDRRDAVFLKHRKDAKNSDPVAVFVVAPAADIGELRLVAVAAAACPGSSVWIGGRSRLPCLNLSRFCRVRRTTEPVRSIGDRCHPFEERSSRPSI